MSGSNIHRWSLSRTHVPCTSKTLSCPVICRLEEKNYYLISTSNGPFHIETITYIKFYNDHQLQIQINTRISWLLVMITCSNLLSINSFSAFTFVNVFFLLNNEMDRLSIYMEYTIYCEGGLFWSIYLLNSVNSMQLFSWGRGFYSVLKICTVHGEYHSFLLPATSSLSLSHRHLFICKTSSIYLSFTEDL